MIAHDRQLLANTFFIEAASSLKDGGFITKEQLSDAKFKTPRLKTNSNFGAYRLYDLGLIVVFVDCGRDFVLWTFADRHGKL